MSHMRSIYREAIAKLKPGKRVRRVENGIVCIVGSRAGTSVNVRFWLMTESPPYKKVLEHAGILMNPKHYEILES